MAAKKSEDKKIMDVAHPNSTPAPSTGKPVIVTNRPIMKDPTIVEGSSPKQIQVKTGGEKKIQPLSDGSAEPKVDSKGEPLSAPVLPIEEAEAQVDKQKAQKEAKMAAKA